MEPNTDPDKVITHAVTFPIEPPSTTHGDEVPEETEVEEASAK